MRRPLTTVLLALALLGGGTQAAAASPHSDCAGSEAGRCTLEPPSPQSAIHGSGSPLATSAGGSDWLGEINLYRQAAGLAPVTDQPSWDTGIEHHLTYMADTPAQYFAGQYQSLHTENPQSPYYTADGALEGSRSDLAWDFWGATPVNFIDFCQRSRNWAAGLEIAHVMGPVAARRGPCGRS